MDSLPTQLAIPGQYSPLHRNMIAPSLRAQIQNNNRILHTHKNVLPVTAFREDEYTSKVGGLPCWLPPSPPQQSPSAPPQPYVKFNQPIPTCPGCRNSMMLITQMFSPIDFITDLEGFDSSKPLVSCFTSSIIKKFAASINLNSTAPHTLITVSRHARSLYVFACPQGLCAYNPGAWKTVAIVQSVPKDIVFDPVGHVLNKRQQQKQRLLLAKQQNQASLDDDDDDDDDEFDDEDEEYDDEDDYDDEDGLDDIDMDDDEIVDGKDNDTNVLPVLDVAPQSQSPALLTLSKLPSAVKKTKNDNSKDLFAMAGFTSSDDDLAITKTTTNKAKYSTMSMPDTTPKAKTGLFTMPSFSDSDDDSDAEAKDLERLQKLVAETQALQMKTAGKSEKQITGEIEKQKKMKKLQKMAEKGQTRAPIVLEPKVLEENHQLFTPQLDQLNNYNNNNNNDGPAQPDPNDPKLIVYDDVVFFRPFYLWWQGEEATSKGGDYSKEQQLLHDYFAQRNLDDDGEQNDENDRNNNLNGNNVDDVDGGDRKNNEDGDDGDEDEDDENCREDPYDMYQDAINNQPEQVIRYFNSHLSLHSTPKNDSVDKFKKSSRQHSLQKFTTQSGVWLLHDVPKCKTCGDDLTLECQILPTLLSELKPDEFELIYHRTRLSTHKKPTPTTQRNNIELVDEEGEDEKAKRAAQREARIMEKKYDFDWGLVNVYHCLNLCTPDEYTNGFCLVQPGM